LITAWLDLGNYVVGERSLKGVRMKARTLALRFRLVPAVLLAVFGVANAQRPGAPPPPDSQAGEHRMRATHQQIQAETLQQLTPVLTSTQLKKFQVLMEEGRGRGGPHGPPRSGDAPSDSTH
jgi:hypothetical protein